MGSSVRIADAGSPRAVESHALGLRDGLADGAIYLRRGVDPATVTEAEIQYVALLAAEDAGADKTYYAEGYGLGLKQASERRS